MSVKIYVAHAMTGRTGDDLRYESDKLSLLAKPYNVTLLDPVVAEHVKHSKRPLHNSPNKLQEYWYRDKEMIREAHVLLDITGPAKSEGVAHEIGYARFCLWKPVIRLWPNLGPSIAWIEDDLIVGDVESAFAAISDRWGTLRQRLVWRAKLLNNSLPKWLWYQIKEWK